MRSSLRSGRAAAQTRHGAFRQSVDATVIALEQRTLLATIEGNVYNDQNGNGRIDDGEPTRAGIEVYLDQNANDTRDADEIFTTTDATGYYTFTVDAGTYRVNQAKSEDDLRTVPGSGRFLTGSLFFGSFSTLQYQIDPITSNPIAEAVDTLEEQDAIRGDIRYSPVYDPNLRDRVYIGQRSTTSADWIGVNSTLVLPISHPVTASAIIGDEMFLFAPAATTVFVLNLESKTLVRSFSVPADLYPVMVAMPDKGQLLFAKRGHLVTVDPQTGTVNSSVACPAIPATQPRLLYSAGTVYVVFGINYTAVNPSNGSTLFTKTHSANVGQLWFADTPSHLVTVADEQTSAVNFARATYSPTALPPVVLSTTYNGTERTDRIAVRGTVAGGSLWVAGGMNSFWHAASHRVDVPTADGITYVDVPTALIKAWWTTNHPGFRVSQRLPGHLPQRFHSNLSAPDTSSLIKLYGKGRSGSVASSFDTALPTFLVVNDATSVFPAASTVHEIFADDELKRTATGMLTSSSGEITSTVPVADGTHAFRLLSTRINTISGGLVAIQSDRWAARTYTIDTVVPTATTSYDVDAATPSVVIRASELLYGSISASDVSLQQIDAAGNVIGTVDVSVSAVSGTDVRITPTESTVLPNGRYRLTMLSAGTLRDGAAHPLSVVAPFEFHVLAGDATRDGVVDFNDLLILAQNYNQTGKTFTQGNVDYSADGSVNFNDLLLLAQNYGQQALAAREPPSTPKDKLRRRSDVSAI
jgi:SdrD B-like domain